MCSLHPSRGASTPVYESILFTGCGEPDTLVKQFNNQSWPSNCNNLMGMEFSRRFTSGLLVCAVALSRFLFRSHYLYDIDSVNYALALDRFDPTVHQPHPPGYFLYVYLGRLARLAFRDSNTALVFLSIVASCAAAAMIYVLA